MKGREGGPGGMRCFFIMSLIRMRMGSRSIPMRLYQERRVDRSDMVEYQP